MRPKSCPKSLQRAQKSRRQVQGGQHKQKPQSTNGKENLRRPIEAQELSRLLFLSPLVCLRFELIDGTHDPSPTEKSSRLDLNRTGPIIFYVHPNPRRQELRDDVDARARVCRDGARVVETPPFASANGASN